MTVNYFIVKSVKCCLYDWQFHETERFWKVEFKEIFKKLRVLTKCCK